MTVRSSHSSCLTYEIKRSGKEGVIFISSFHANAKGGERYVQGRAARMRSRSGTGRGGTVARALRPSQASLSLMGGIAPTCRA